MRRTDAVLALTVCACLASCTPAKQAAGEPNSSTSAPRDVAPPATTVEAAPSIAIAADTHQDPIKPPTAAEARQLVIDYYAAINAHDYHGAYARWSDDGAASGQSFEHFSAGYANTESVEADVGEATDEEGAAGSRYITVPVQLQARQYNGTIRGYRGRFALRAVVADGASERQRRWHLYSAEMQRTP